jgi:hypothetical protein
MPRQIKFDDCPFEKVVYNGKIFMYSNSSFDVLFPIVDIIRLFKKTTIIGHLYDKGQKTIKLYGSQYFHSVLGYELKTKQDYQQIKTAKCIFIFSDIQDRIATNLLNFAKEMRILAVCYSNIDHVYHFYDYLNHSVERDIQTYSLPEKSVNVQVFNTAQEVINKMYNLFEFIDNKKLADLFPEFEIIEAEEDIGPTCLDKCVMLLKESSDTIKNKKSDTSIIKVGFDIHTAKLKKMAYLKSQKAVKYDDNLEDLSKKLKKVNLCSKFFK